MICLSADRKLDFVIPYGMCVGDRLLVPYALPAAAEPLWTFPPASANDTSATCITVALGARMRAFKSPKGHLM